MDRRTERTRGTAIGGGGSQRPKATDRRTDGGNRSTGSKRTEVAEARTDRLTEAAGQTEEDNQGDGE